MFGASGPSHKAMRNAEKNDPRVRIVDVDEVVARNVIAGQNADTFARSLGDIPQRRDLIGAGDILDVTIWEAPPAALFAPMSVGSLETSGISIARPSEMPQQRVDADGRITVPFVGSVAAVGRSPSAVAREITSRLSGMAHRPQTIVRIADNQGANVTVVGDVNSSRRVPLTTKNERLLDALASAGGVRQSVDKVLVQITRGKTVVSRPLSAIIRDPQENITLVANDVITALYQPYSFQAMGAFVATAEINFEGTGITLAQAIARVGGLQDNRANIKGLFIFRFEDPVALPPASRIGAPLTPEGKVPVIYRIDMSNPSTFFLLQTFPVNNRDILYVSNAPIADLQKFVTLVSQLTFSVAGIVNTVR
jgi:polysaccharide biosynthesis/export protein